jgi:acetyl esterase/lipase
MMTDMQAHPVNNLPLSIPLWPEGKTPFAGPEDGLFPRFTHYSPSDEYQTGVSVLILPGGGYSLVSTPKEGHRVAQLLTAHGIASGVLEYRHAPQRHPVPLTDAQRALRWMRVRAQDQGIASGPVGVMGFSAGGHLAGTLATQPEVEEGRVGDEVDAFPCRPDFAALIYPVVSFTEPWSHFGSRDNLLGPDADPALTETLSIEKAVSSSTPPMFLFHTQADGAVPVQNSLRLAEALTEHGVAVDLHVYAEGSHGIGLAANHAWGQLLLAWLEKLTPAG